MNDMILILDFGGGSQSQGVARKVRSEQVYCEVLPYNVPVETIRDKAPKGIILVGGCQDAPEGRASCDPQVYELGVPLLAIGYGARAMLAQAGGRLMGCVLENRTARLTFEDSALFEGLTESERYFERVDAIELPQGFRVTAHGDGVLAAFENDEKKLYGMQFYAEQNDPDGLTILANFAFGICECEAWWSMDAFVERELGRIREQVGSGSALLAMSGGVDSSVCAALMHRAIGRQLHCLYVDTGLMRKGESAVVERVFRDQMGMDLTVVYAGERFLSKLKGVTDPEKKRKIIGEEFIRVFEDEAKKIGEVDYLVQGTIYPDVIESFGVDGALVKSHHNVGGLPDAIKFKALVEPVRELFKDEVRQVGEVLGMPKEIIYRQPFPGPGLAVRCIGEVNEAKLSILREADAIFREEIMAASLDRKIWQYFVVLTDMRSVGVRNNQRSYEYTVALRAINSVDAMAATAVRLPYDLLERVVGRITNEVPGINRVVYDITGKPPATIEWE